MIDYFIRSYYKNKVYNSMQTYFEKGIYTHSYSFNKSSILVTYITYKLFFIDYVLQMYRMELTHF